MLVQQWRSGPVSVELLAPPGPFTLAEVPEVQLVVTLPAASLEETLRTGRDSLYRFDASAGPWHRIGGLRLLPVAPASKETVPGGRIRTVHRYRFEPRRPGDFELPPLDLVFVAPAVAPITLRTEPLRFTVRGLVNGDPLQVDPRPVLDLPPAQGNGRGASSLIFLVVAGVAFWRWRERAEPPVVALDSPGPGERALRELAASRDPGQWRAILEGYAGAGLVHPARRAGELRELLRDLDRLRFGREGVGRKALRRRLETFIREGER